MSRFLFILITALFVAERGYCSYNGGFLGVDGLDWSHDDLGVDFNAFFPEVNFEEIIDFSDLKLPPIRQTMDDYVKDPEIFKRMQGSVAAKEPRAMKARKIATFNEEGEKNKGTKRGRDSFNSILFPEIPEDESVFKKPYVYEKLPPEPTRVFNTVSEKWGKPVPQHKRLFISPDPGIYLHMRFCSERRP